MGSTGAAPPSHALQRMARRRLWIGCAAIAACGCVVVQVGQPTEPSDRIQSDVEMVRQEMTDIRALGMAFEGFAIDNNEYPTLDCSDRVLGDLPFCKVERLSTVLKIYARVLPKLDPWDAPYLFWSDGQHYVVIGFGGDGAIARPERLAEVLRSLAMGEDVEQTRSNCIEDEVMFATGAFVWVPRDWIRWCDAPTRKPGGGTR